MDGTILRDTLQAILSEKVIKQFADKFDVIERDRKREIEKLVYSLVLSAGSDDSGVLAEACRRYNSEARSGVVRGSFYTWLDKEMALLMERLVEEGIGYMMTLPTLLPGILGTVDDWYIFDSETVTLRDKLADIFPGTGSKAAVKVHKELSVGRGCMTGFHFSPAREHDSPHLFIDERYSGAGLLIDLGYVSLARIAEFEKYDVKFVQRLKDNWKPKVDRISSGEVRGEFFAGDDFDELLMNEVIVLDGHCVDADVRLGKGKQQVKCRLVMIPGPTSYLIYLTNLSRSTHSPQQVGDLYRVRYEIELDNKTDKSAAQLDQIRATTESSVKIQLCAKLLHTLIVDALIHQDNLERVRHGGVCRGPLHRIMLGYAIRSRHAVLAAALILTETSEGQWERLAEQIANDGRDPNWRSRPSVLDSLMGLTAPRGRPRKKKLKDCPPTAAPFRRASNSAARI